MDPAPPVDLPVGFAHIAVALAKAQTELSDPVKNRTADIKSDKGNYKYAYADLPAVYEAVRPALTKNGLAIVHDVAMNSGRVVVSTRLLHGSGEQLCNELSWTVPGRIQELGSIITFLKRYCLCALVGVAADEDDDANVADNRPASTTDRRPAPKKEAAPPQGEATADPFDAPAGHQELAKLLVKIATDLGAAIKGSDEVDTLERALVATRVPKLTDAKLAELLPKFRAPTPVLLEWVKKKLTDAGLIGQKPGTPKT